MAFLAIICHNITSARDSISMLREIMGHATEAVITRSLNQYRISENRLYFAAHVERMDSKAGPVAARRRSVERRHRD